MGIGVFVSKLSTPAGSNKQTDNNISSSAKSLLALCVYFSWYALGTKIHLDYICSLASMC
jgi:hypothetical protein